MRQHWQEPQENGHKDVVRRPLFDSRAAQEGGLAKFTRILEISISNTALGFALDLVVEGVKTWDILVRTSSIIK